MISTLPTTDRVSNPDYLTAVRVMTRRDGMANSPVTTYFAGAVGLSEVSMATSSTALLGYAGSVLEGEVDLPIAVEESAISGGDGPLCGNALEFHDENDENTSWTTFFTYPSNDPNVKKFVNGSMTIPAIEVGDVIASTNGNLSNNTFDALYNRFSAEGSDLDGDGEPDYWPVTLPVYPAHGQPIRDQGDRFRRDDHHQGKPRAGQKHPGLFAMRQGHTQLPDRRRQFRQQGRIRQDNQVGVR